MTWSSDINTSAQTSRSAAKDSELQGHLSEKLGQLTALEEIYLNHNQLTGPIPWQLGELKHLEVLSLDNNQLTGEIPRSLGDLTSLQQLWLWKNRLSGPIPRELGQLKSLTDLHLHQNDLEGPIPKELGALSELEDLRLAYNKLTGEIPPELGQLKALTHLFLFQNHLTGRLPASLGNLKELKLLQLAMNHLAGEIPKEIGNLEKVQQMDFFNNEFSGELPEELGQLYQLTKLSLPLNGITGRIPKQLGQLSKLQVLQLSSNQLQGEIPRELGRLENLRELSLFDNQLTGEIPAELGNMQMLQTLSLEQNRLSGEIPMGLGQLKSLQRLSLAKNQFQGIPRALSNLVALREMNLQANRFSGIPNDFGQLQALEALRLDENQLLGPIPPEIGQMASLKLVNMSSNRLHGEIPKQIGQLEELKRLQLYENRLTGEIPLEMGKLKNLELLDLTYNRLNGQIPRELGELKSLQVLHLGFNRLTGEIPKSLGHLSLRWLVLQDNQLNGSIPIELGNLQFLERLYLSYNHLEGPIPKEFGELKALSSLWMNHNRLSGPIPRELGRLYSLEEIILGNNQLTGEIPSEFEHLKTLRRLFLRGNGLQGKIPPELGRSTGLKELDLSENQLSGTVPDLSKLLELSHLSLSHNKLTGLIPKGLGKLTHLEELYLDNNYLHGEIPLELTDLPLLEWLYLDHNQLQGEIPAALTKLQSLTRLSLGANYFSGQLPSLAELRNLEEVTLSRNRLHGPIPSLPRHLTLLDLCHNSLSGLPLLPSTLQRVDLSHNGFTGALAEVVQPFCNSTPAVSLRELRLSHNHFTGELPWCLLNFSSLKHLSLNNNDLRGTVPALPAESQLVVLALHRNAFTGAVSKSWRNLRHLAVLTLHENSFDGVIAELNLTTPCLDNPEFIIQGLGCNAVRNVLDGEPCLKLKKTLAPKEVEAILQNCPDLCGTCLQQSSRATFHHNRFSCAVPERISTGETHATAVMGNMLGHGYQLTMPWIAAEENQVFLYYSPKIWSANVLILGTMSFLVLAALLLQQPLRRRLNEACRSMAAAADASRVAASNLAVLKICGCTALLAGPLLLFFVLGTGCYSCSPPLSQMTVANLRDDSSVQQGGVVVAWCVITLLFRNVLESMPKTNKPPEADSRKGIKEQLMKVAAWLLWLLVVATLSLPSILFAVAQALPAKNTSGLSQKMLSLVHRLAPFLIVLIDMLLACPLSTKYSARSGIKAGLLLMTFRLASAWLLSLLTTIVLHENCLGAWKFFWIVCKKDAPEHQNFNWQIWGEEILNTSNDMCTFSDSWWTDGRCSRAIVDGLAPLLLKKLLLRSTLQPLVLLSIWRLGSVELKDPSDREEGRHLRLWGRGPKITGSLVPLQQMALLTTHLETLFFWSPLIPLMTLAIFGAATANLLLFDVGLWRFNVQVPSDVVNHSAALSRSYLKLALGASSCFQLWHAFSTEMFGRHLLLLLNLLLLVPWTSRRVLPLNFARRWFWTDLDRASENEFIQMAIELELMG